MNTFISKKSNIYLTNEPKAYLFFNIGLGTYPQF